MRFPGLVGNGSYLGRSRLADSERSINLYTELIESGQGTERYAMYVTPGRKKFAQIPDFPIRALWQGDHRLFAVGGGTFYEVFEDGTSHAIGAIAPGTTPVQIFANASSPGTQLFITSAGQGYSCDGVTITPVVAAATGTFLDGYAIAAQPNSKQFNISAINNFASWNALDFAIKEGWPDNIAAVWMDHKLLWILGFETTEIYYDSGAANFPFVPVQSGGFIQHGCVAPFSLAQVGESIMWLAGDEAGNGWIAQSQGLVPQRVSNHALEFTLTQYLQIQDAFAYAYQDGGHFFYVIHFPTALKVGNQTVGQTWVYDLTTNQWHQRGLWNPNLGVFDMDVKAGSHAFGSWPTSPTTGIHFTGDTRNGNIYVQSTSYYDDDGDPRRWLRAAPHLVDELKNLGYGRMILNIQRGVSAPGMTPKVMMRYSDDGGFTWSNERLAGVGSGKYRNRIAWRGLGSGRDRVFEISGTDPIDWCLTDAYLRPGQSTDT